LGREDFTQGKVSEKRKNVTELKHKTTQFGDETDEVLKILEPLTQAYQNRPTVSDKWDNEKKGKETTNDKSNMGNGVVS